MSARSYKEHLKEAAGAPKSSGWRNFKAGSLKVRAVIIYQSSTYASRS